MMFFKDLLLDFSMNDKDLVVGNLKRSFTKHFVARKNPTNAAT